MKQACQRITFSAGVAVSCSRRPCGVAVGVVGFAFDERSVAAGQCCRAAEMILGEVVECRAGLLSNLVVDAGSVQIFRDDVRAGFVLRYVITIVGEVR